MDLKEKIYLLIKNNTNESLLEEIHEILLESNNNIYLSDDQLKRIDLAEEEAKYGKIIPNEEVLNKLKNGE